MSTAGKWFVMMNSQYGQYIMALENDDGEVELWDTEEEANDAASENPFASAFGFHAYQVES